MTDVNKKISDPETLAITRESAGYRVQAGVDGRRCGECRWFEAGLCTRGIIGLTKVDADDACEEFRHTLADGSLSHQEAEVTMQTASHLHNRHLFINRVSEDPQTGVRRWYSTSSGVKRDLYGERMSKSLFRDFIKRIELRESPPEPFTSKAWTGGLPYLGVAHYLDLEGEGIAGDTVRVWPDGTFLKMKGTFANNKLGNAAYDAIKQDIRDNVPHDERVRVSIAFVDYGHEHEHIGQFERKSLMDKCPYCEAGKEDKIYQKGQLVHLALTRRPAYPEADIQLEEKSMSQRKDDAASIVGEELAEGLEENSKLTERSADIDPDAIVVREDAPEKEMDGEDEEGKKKKKKEEDEDSEEEEMVYESLGGAKSLDEADSYITSRSKDVPLLDSWAIFASVLVNIAGDDNTEAVYSTVSEFQERLDIMALRALMKVSDLIEREEAVGGEEVVEAPVEAPAEGEEAGEEVAEPAVEANPEEEGEIMPEKSEAIHPLDEALVSLKDSFDEVMAEPMSEAERLIALQEPVNALAASIKRSIETPVEGVSIGDGEAVKALVAEAVAPFMAEIARLNASISTEKSTVEPKAPVRRAITVGNTITVPQNEVKPRSGFTPLKDIVRRSVGLNED